MTEWNANNYLLFESERTVPAQELASKISIKNPQNILDLGCGPGNSTNAIFYKFPGAKILGLDSSEDMINKAQEIHPHLNFKLFDLNKDMSFLNGRMDVVFSNGCLQWITNHERLLPRLIDLLKDKGILAVQMPNNFNEPIHKLITKVVKSDKWINIFSETRSINLLSPAEYYNILAERCTSIKMWETSYYHILDNAEAILDWYRGTGLRPYLAKLDDEAKKDFEEDILKEIRLNYPEEKDGKVIFKFPRLFFIASK